MLRPGMDAPRGDIELLDGKSQSGWLLSLDGGFRGGCQIGTMSDSGQNNVVMSAQEKLLGNFDEQHDWKGGRGTENFRDNPSGYYDGSAWTLASNHVVSALQWQISAGYRAANQDMPGNCTFQALLGTRLYVAVSFSATTYDADKCMIWLKRVGNPGTCTLEICADGTNKPGAAAKTATVTTSTITDIMSIFHDFDWTTTSSLVNATTYYLNVYGASTDNADNHWEVGGDASGTSGFKSANGSTYSTDTWSMFYRVTDADTALRWFFFSTPTTFDGTSSFFAVSSPDAGNSELYGWNETTDVWAAAGGVTGLGKVVSPPLVCNGQVNFPQGTTTIRKWNGTDWADDATDDATLLCMGYDAADGPQVWRAYTNSVARANIQAWSTDFTFRTAITVGDSSYSITGMIWFQDQLWVLKGDSLWTIKNDRAVKLEYGVKDAPSSTNGQAVGVWQQFLFFNWLFSDERLYGGTLDDIGQGWAGPALPYGREGVTSKYTAYMGWLFVAKDAGTTGTSAVFAYDGLAWHEVFRAWDTGLRVRDICIQVVSGARSRLWIECGDNLVYIELPLNKANPLYDTALNYMHESYIISPTLDAGASSRLPKYIRDLTAVTENLATGRQIYVDYQVDDGIGSSTWSEANGFFKSPEDTVIVNEGDVRQFRYRLRMQTNDSDEPPILSSTALNGFARSPFRMVYTFRIKAGDSYSPDGKKGVDSQKLMRWLLDAARYPGKVRMTSIHPLLHDTHIIISPPSIMPQAAPSQAQEQKDIATIVVVEA